MKTIKIKNLAHLKRVLQEGAEYQMVMHKTHPESVGLIRKVSFVQTNGVYSKIKDQPNHKYSLCNYGKGTFLEFCKAGHYVFGDTVKFLYGKHKEVLYEFAVLDTSNSEVTSNA